MLENTGWQFLPAAGGLLDQEAALMEDLFTLSWRKRVVKELMKRGPSGPTKDRRDDTDSVTPGPADL